MNFRGYLVPLCLLPNRLKGFAVLDSKISQVWACVGVDVCLYGRRRCCTWCHWVYLQDCDVHSKCWHTGSHTHALPTVSPTGTTAATTCLNRETHPHKHTTMVTLGTLKHIMHTCPYQQHKGPLTHSHTHTHWQTLWHKHEHLILNSVPFVSWKCFEAAWISKTFHEDCPWPVFCVMFEETQICHKNRRQ